MTVGISFPYTIDTAGVATATTDSSKVYVDRVLTLLSTNIGQRPMMPDYGVDWSGALFENDNMIAPAVTQAVKVAVGKWIPEVTVSTINFSVIGTEGKEIVSIGLELPNGDIATVGLNSGTLNAYGSTTR